MLLQSVTALGLVQGGSESIWMYVEALVRSTEWLGVWLVASGSIYILLILHLETPAGDVLITYENWLLFDYYDYAEWIRQLWIEMI